MGDITEVVCDAIVNPANSLMIMGGGVAGAIKRKGGTAIEKEAKKFAPVPIGEAVVTSAGSLKAKYVIHAPTMEKPAMQTTKDKVERAIRAALMKAIELGVECIAFPGMGTGVGGLSADDFVTIFLKVLSEIRNSLLRSSIRRILLVAYTSELYEAMKKVERELDLENF